MRCRLVFFHAILVQLFLFQLSLARPALHWRLPGDNTTGEGLLPEGAILGNHTLDLEYDYDDLYTEYDREEEEEENEGDEEIPDFLPPPQLPTGDKSARDNTTDTFREAPEYMLDLYNRFSQGQYIHPTSNIVRSFTNINQEDREYPELINGQLPGKKTRFHTLVFNITSISPDEDIDHAQLRLYTLVQQDRSTYKGVDRKVSVLEDLGKTLPENEKYRMLSSRHIYGKNSGWEAFDVTSAVQRWVNNVSCVQMLEVRIESVFHAVTEGDMDIDIDPSNKNEPLLVIFSNDVQMKRLHEKELHELITHEITDVYNEQKPKVKRVEPPESVPVKHQNNTLKHRTRRSKRNRRNSCRRRPLYIDFEDIHWHKWIIAPAGYQAFECTGKCYLPLSDHLTPTKHAIIQTTFHDANPKVASRACCVPTKLAPISILYLDENNVITYKYRYDDMVVAECGCR